MQTGALITSKTGAHGLITFHGVSPHEGPLTPTPLHCRQDPRTGTTVGFTVCITIQTILVCITYKHHHQANAVLGTYFREMKTYVQTQRHSRQLCLQPCYDLNENPSPHDSTWKSMVHSMTVSGGGVDLCGVGSSGSHWRLSLKWVVDYIVSLFFASGLLTCGHTIVIFGLHQTPKQWTI
jgi:hypothetical protein